ncbi:hypothetical protein [Tenacibaculum halocynthiae]|uniref:hypothetical protein n=1 Tax=Tenacibaculum halocynthiae TaxID=1254437 RepID=UPI0038961F7A
MNKAKFYSIYIPALEKALLNDNNREAFYVAPPEDYISNDLISDIDNYLETCNDSFLTRVAYYFDAVSHGFPDINGLNIDTYKKDLLLKINEIKKEIL